MIGWPMTCSLICSALGELLSTWLNLTPKKESRVVAFVTFGAIIPHFPPTKTVILYFKYAMITLLPLRLPPLGFPVLLLAFLPSFYAVRPTAQVQGPPTSKKPFRGHKITLVSIHIAGGLLFRPPRIPNRLKSIRKGPDSYRVRPLPCQSG